jgi:D-beta-D-heptose 7-phosphate kinase/D-beta-D-heptose 1-phosphate adenosyltransferase
MPGQVVPLHDAQAALAGERARGATVVLTNGVFDILHVGHLRYLRQAKALADVLVVGVNTDASVRTLKPGRPINPEAERAELLAALRPVDYVVLFAEATADALIAALRPDVYAKGGDYTPATLPEAATAISVGAQVRILPLVADRSTSRLLERLAQIETQSD